MSDIETVTIDSGAALLAIVSGAAAKNSDEGVRVKFENEPSQSVLDIFADEFDMNHND